MRSYAGGESFLALDIGGDLRERRELPAPRDVVEDRVKALELGGERDPKIRLAIDELAGNTVLVGVGEVDAVKLEVEERPPRHPIDQLAAHPARRDEQRR